MLTVLKAGGHEGTISWRVISWLVQSVFYVIYDEWKKMQLLEIIGEVWARPAQIAATGLLKEYKKINLQELCEKMDHYSDLSIQ